MPPSRTQKRSSKSNSTTRGAHKNTGPGTGVEPEAFLEAVEGVLVDPERSVDHTSTSTSDTQPAEPANANALVAPTPQPPPARSPPRSLPPVPSPSATAAKTKTQPLTPELIEDILSKAKCDELLRMKFVTVDLDMEDFGDDADLGSDGDVDAGPGAPDSHEDEDADADSTQAPSHRSRWWVESYAVKRSGEVEYYVVFEDLHLRPRVGPV